MKLPDTFISYLVTSRGAATIFLINGIKLSGIITAYDETAITLTRDGTTQLIHRHAIASIMPQESFQIQDIVGK